MSTPQVVMEQVGVVVLLVALSFSRGQQLLSVFPSQNVLQVGETAHLTCTSLAGHPVLVWNHSHLTNGRTVAVAHHAAVNISDGRHSVSISETEAHVQSVLTIHDVTLDDGGLYSCKDLSQRHVSHRLSSLVVLAGPPSCSVTPPNYVEGDTVRLSCQIQCSGQYRPVMEWTGPYGSIHSSQVTDESTLEQVKTTITFKVTEDLEGAQYRCTTLFNNPLNPLPYNHTHNFEPVDVQYSPRNLTIGPTKQVYVPGDFVVCGGQGKPRPRFEWRDDDSLARCQGATLLITEHMEGHRSYSCVATNVIRGQEVHTRRTIKLFVHKSGGTPYPRHQNPALCIMPVSQPTTPGKDLDQLYTTRGGLSSVWDNDYTTITPQSLLGQSNVFNNMIVLPCAIAIVVIIVALVAVAIYCSKHKKAQHAGFINDAHNINNDVYLRTCGAGGPVLCTAQPNQYASARKLNMKQRHSKGISQEDLQKHIDDSDDASSGFYSELVLPDEPTTPVELKAPELPAKRIPDSNGNLHFLAGHGVGGYEDADGYLMPRMDRV